MMPHEIKVGQHGEGCKCPHCSIYWPYAHWKEADQTKCETLRKKKGDRIVAHEKEKAQYEEDCKNYERPWELWQHKGKYSTTWIDCKDSPMFTPHQQYRRKQADRCEHCGSGNDAHHSYTCPTGKHPDRAGVFQPEYFSGLNWREALEKGLVGNVVEFSRNGDSWCTGWLTQIKDSDCTENRFVGPSGLGYTYIRTCPETYQDKHPTITIGGVKLPKPETVSPRMGSTVWIVTPFRPQGYVETVWKGYGIDQIAFKKGFVHLKESRAQEWADWWDETVVKAVNK